jgi:hypothetical protein
MTDPSDRSEDYMLGAYDCALFVCDALDMKMSPEDLMEELGNIIANFNDERSYHFQRDMNVRTISKKERERIKI